MQMGSHDLGVLKAAYSYIQNQLSPSKVIPLDYLETLLPEDLDCVDESMFEELTYTDEEVKFLLKELSKVITKFEK